MTVFNYECVLCCDVVVLCSPSSPGAAERLKKVQSKLAKIGVLMPGEPAPEPVSPGARKLRLDILNRLRRVQSLVAIHSERSTIGIGMDAIGINLRVPDDVLTQPSRYAEFDTRLVGAAAVALVGTAANAGGLTVGTELSTDESDHQAVSDNKLPYVQPQSLPTGPDRTCVM